MTMSAQQSSGAVAPAEDGDNLTHLADALGSAMAGRRADGLVAEAAGADGGRARDLLAQVVADAVARHGRLPDGLATLPEELGMLRGQAAELKESLAETTRRLEALAEGQARQHDALLQRADRIDEALGGVSKRLQDGLAEELDSIDERIARLADAGQLREQRQGRLASFALVGWAALALVAGLLAGAVAVAAFPDSLLEPLRSVLAGLPRT